MEVWNSSKLFIVTNIKKFTLSQHLVRINYICNEPITILNKMKNLQILLTACTIAMLFYSCNNDYDVSIDDRATAILGQWEYVSIMSDRAVDLNGDNESNIDLFGTQELRQCVKDNLTLFTENGPSNKPEFNVNENNLTCDNNDPFSLVEEDFWTLSNNNTVITFENRNPYRIIELTNDRLVVEMDDVFEGLDYTVTTVYSKR